MRELLPLVPSPRNAIALWGAYPFPLIGDLSGDWHRIGEWTPRNSLPLAMDRAALRIEPRSLAINSPGNNDEIDAERDLPRNNAQRSNRHNPYPDADNQAATHIFISRFDVCSCVNASRSAS